MKRFTVTFSKVGRDSREWILDCEQTTHDTFMKSIRDNRALMSREVEFLFSSVPQDAGDFGEGLIECGGRIVGQFHIKQNR